MKILVSGASGLLGNALSHALTRDAHQISRLVRKTPRSDQELFWRPNAGELEAGQLEGFDVVIHLSGEGIASGRWTESKKQAIRDSRIKSTTLLATTLAGLTQKPKLFVCASAIGFYGDRGDLELTEEASPGEGFLAEVTVAWEQATQPASDAGIRTVNLRIGVVLAAEGGALPKMAVPFKLGIAGKLGSGRQYMSWIAIDDIVGAVQFAIDHEQLSGPVNMTAPEPIRNAEFTATMGRVLRRPTIFSAPAFALRLIMGEMADEMLLGSFRVVPEKLQAAGYSFKYADLESALRTYLNRPA